MSNPTAVATAGSPNDFFRWVLTLPHGDNILGDFIADTKVLLDVDKDPASRLFNAEDVPRQVCNALLRVYVPFVAHDNVDPELTAMYNAALPDQP